MMEEEARGGPHDKKQKHKCVINIFCNEKKHSDMAWDHDDDDGCIINVFCDDDNHHDPDCDKKDGNCVINIFCNNKKCDNPCDKEKW